jgi:hypothetical protein
LITHCQQQERAHYTPSDYGLGGRLDYRELAAFLDAESGGRPRHAFISRLYGLSPLQEGLLFHGLYDKETPSYLEQTTCRFTGLEVEPFRESWIYVLQQHSILRTSFHHQDLSVPIQCVHKSVTLPFEVLNYEALSPEEQERELAAFLAADKKCGFDFTQAPLLRLP